MTYEELNKYISEVKSMSQEELREFASSVHNAVGLEYDTKRELLEAIDDRQDELDCVFSPAVENGDLDDLELD